MGKFKCEKLNGFFSAKIFDLHFWCVLNKNDNDNKGNLRALAEEGTLITNSCCTFVLTSSFSVSNLTPPH